MPEQRGFTLIELLVTITVLAIVLGVGLPGLRDFVLNNRQVSAVNDMVGNLQYARTEAVARNRTVSVCPSANGTSCSGSDWSVGWIVFNDDDGDGAMDGGDEVVLRRVEARGNLDFVSEGGIASAVTYRRNGRAVATGNFRICDSRGASHGKQIVMDLAGRPRVEKLSGSCP
jgi:type IV fimbrial biogenesis protein FimT